MVNKFRIYDKLNKEYCEEPDYRWLLSRQGKLYNSENDEWHIDGARYVIEFSTGIFDNNYVEIYDGDILKGITDNEFAEKKESNYEVMKGRDSWHIKGTFFSIQELFNYCNNKVSVIGNKHHKKFTP